MTENKIEKPYYIELKEFYNKNKGEVYSFQDIENAGSYEYRVFTKKIKPLKLFEQNKSAAKLVKILLEVLYNKKNYKDIEEYLKSNQVIYYYESIRQTLSTVIENNDTNKELLTQFVNNVILNSQNEEMVKLALIMAQLLEVDNLEEILNIFSIHNSFIFYVINDYSHMNNKNNKIFEIAKHAEYYGKFFALVHLKALTYEIENWLVEYGCTDNYPIPEIIEYSILSVDILEYLNRAKLDSHNIELFTKAFCTVLSDYGLGEINNKVAVCNKILEAVHEVSGGIYSLYAVVSILYSVDGILVDYYKENKNIETLDECEEYKRIIELCTDIVNEPHWHDVIKDEINNVELETDVLIGCIEKTSYKLKKKEYENILKRNYCSPLLYKYGLCSGSKAIRKTAFKLGIANLPIDDMTMEPKDKRLGSLTYDDIEYICFYILITYSEIEDFNDDINEYKYISLR
ncbi:MAG TPA: DNA-binding protein, partial [Clostridium sp.]|nr:DNA-binding protein [Clostridium sp.]